LGANTTTDSVSRFTESRLAPNIGLDELRQVSFSLVFKLKTKAGSEQFKPADAGQLAKASEDDI
jgi:hypothetical protein